MILVTGANGVVGIPLCQALKQRQLEFLSVSRTASNRDQILRWDLQTAADAAMISRLSGVQTLIHCAPLWLLPKHIDALEQAGVRRVLAFSSSSVIGKAQSDDPSEQEVVRLLVGAEQDLQRACQSLGVALTLFRPAMIYGYGLDQNVMKIATVIRRFGFAVLAGRGRGKRQPVHADDLVLACLNALDNPISHDKTYVLAGGEVLSYHSMVERIFTGMKRTPRIVCVPTPLVRIGLKIAGMLSAFSYTAAMADRMSQDLVYDYQDAARDLGFNPQRFLISPERDLPEPVTSGADA